MASPVHFAVLQREFSSPSAEQLKRAFSSFSHLTDADAVRLAVNARGILMRQLNRDSARAFLRALEAEGVNAAMVAEDELPRLPEAKSLRHVEITPQAIIVYDLLGRTTAIDWNSIAFIVVGAVRQHELAKTQTERTVLGFNPLTGLQPKAVMETGHKVEWDSRLVLEMLLAGDGARYQIEAAEFPFKYVIDDPKLSTPEKFVWLVREICRHTPQAILSGGTRAIHDGRDFVLEYDTRQMMADEMVWLLWNSSQQNRSGEK